ncbi:MAG: T9SS type A sorting domain-containing protein [Melioribacteraceae bacterium]|nr:T9SS type A sorting domain-containing protein [Melioribacteraceae bacterium]
MKNLGLTIDPGSAVIGRQGVGGMIGDNRATIENCYVSGNVVGYAYVGGFAGFQNGFIRKCYSTGTVSKGTTSNNYFGGFIGCNSGTIENCYSRSNVSASGLTYVGGFAGENFYANITNSYSTGYVDATTSGTVGGFLGYYNNGTITKCFWDTETSGKASSQGTDVIGKTTAEMKTYSTFSNADWSGDIWSIVTAINDGYPHLQPFNGGNGSSSNPYKIDSKANLIRLSLNSSYWSQSFIQTNDITFLTDETAEDWDLNGTADGISPSGFSPIGNNGTKFTGTYNGQNYKIDNLYISRGLTDYVGLFGFVQGASSKIENLGLTNVEITGQNGVAGLAGQFESGTISKCYVAGTVVGNESVGGLFGLSQTNASITQSYSSGSVSGVSFCGGLFGGNSSMITNCYSRSNVTRTSGTNTAIGAFGGSSNGTVDKCYSTGNVTYSGSSNPNDKGFLGTNSGTATNNFFDNQTSSQSSGTGATAKTTAQMKTNATFTDAEWDVAIWNREDGVNDGYPYLDWQNTGGTPLPVELTSFSADVNGNKVVLNWETATEINNYGFEVERRSFDADASSLGNSSLKSNWSTIGFVQGNGNSNSPKNYSFIDINPPRGKVEYRLKQIDYDGSFEYSQIVTVNVESPTQFSLQQNYPNPFNPITTIKYSIPAGVETSYMTSLRVFDILGKEVAVLVNQKQTAGNYEVKFDGSRLTSGVYFYKLQAGEYYSVKKLLLMK